MRLTLSHKLVLSFVLVASVGVGSLPLVARADVPFWAALTLSLLLAAALGVGLAFWIRHELRELGARMEQSAKRVAACTEELRRSAEHVSTSSREITGTIEIVTRGAVRQQEDVEATSKRTREIGATSRSSVEAARAAAGFASESSQRVDAGFEAARQITARMETVFEQLDRAARLVFQFDDKIRSVRRITEMITSVAEKTHLLALNASIEAARAGEAGRGFSVVADEIRKLAESAGGSAEQIDVQIRQVEEEAERISEVMRELGRGVGEGREQFGTIVSSLERIRAMMQEAAQHSGAILDQAERQIGQADVVIEDIDRIAAVSADSVHATETMRRGITAQVQALDEMVRQATTLTEITEEIEALAPRFRSR